MKSHTTLCTIRQLGGPGSGPIWGESTVKPLDVTYSTKLLSTILIFCLFILGTISIALEINNQFLVLMNIYIQVQAKKWSS